MSASSTTKISKLGATMMSESKFGKATEFSLQPASAVTGLLKILENCDGVNDMTLQENRIDYSVLSNTFQENGVQHHMTSIDEQPKDLISQVSHLTNICEMKMSLLEQQNKLAHLEIANNISDIVNTNTLDGNARKLNDFATVLDTIGKNIGLILDKLQQGRRFEGEVIDRQYHRYVTESLALLQTLPAKVESSLGDFAYIIENMTVDFLKDKCESQFSHTALVEIVSLMCSHRQLVIALQKLSSDEN